MGLVQLKVVFIFFFGGDGRRRQGGRASVVHEGFRGSVVILFYLRVLCEAWLVQLSPYPSRTCLYLYIVVYVFKKLTTAVSPSGGILFLWKKTKLLTSTIAKFLMTPKLLFVHFTLQTVLWFKLPLIQFAIFISPYIYKCSFKLKFYKIIVHTITDVRKIHHMFYYYLDRLRYLIIN